jgi:cytochrome P450
MIFILLIATHTEVQRKAQKELDDRVGKQRLPDFSDRDNLPYVSAILNEVIRVFPVFPLGIPHAVTVEDEYKGMRIPKGSLLFANAW